MNTDDHQPSSAGVIGQNEFGTNLVHALAALGVTEIDRSNRYTIDSAFTAAYTVIGEAVGFERIRTFGALIDPLHTSSIVDDIIRYAWFGRFVSFSNDNLSLLYINRSLTPGDATEYLQELELYELWLAAGRAFMANVITYSNLVDVRR